MKLETKTLLAVSCAVTLATALGIVIVYYISSNNRITELRTKMSSTIAQSEQVADYMDDMHSSKAFDTPGLMATAKAQGNGRSLHDYYAETDIYKTVPIVAAWKSAQATGREERV